MHNTVYSEQCTVNSQNSSVNTVYFTMYSVQETQFLSPEDRDRCKEGMGIRVGREGGWRGEGGGGSDCDSIWLFCWLATINIPGLYCPAHSTSDTTYHSISECTELHCTALLCITQHKRELYNMGTTMALWTPIYCTRLPSLQGQSYLQFAVCSVQCAVCRLQCAVTLCSVQYAVCSVQCSG